MASVATAAVEAGFDHVVILSKDKDMSQIVSDKIHLFHLTKGADGIDFGPAQVVEKYGLPPEKIRDYLALMGDASDNVPGVPKVGPKTAIQLLTDYGDMDNLYAPSAGTLMLWNTMAFMWIPWRAFSRSMKLTACFAC